MIVFHSFFRIYKRIGLWVPHNQTLVMMYDVEGENTVFLVENAQGGGTPNDNPKSSSKKNQKKYSNSPAN
jgi:hypothetical protein